MATTKGPKFKFRMEHKGTVVAESDWSNILFDYLKRDTVKSEHYAIFNNVTGLPAGTPTVTTKKPLPKSAAKRAVQPRPRATTKRTTRNSTSTITR